MKRIRTAVVTAALTVATGGLAAVAAPPASAAYCGQSWGSQAESAASRTAAQLTGVRAGRHTCFDRMVVDLRGKVSGYDVRYVDAVRTDGAGTVVPLRGGARLQVVVAAAAYDANGAATYRPANRSELVDVSGYRTFRQVAWAGSFEGQSTIGLGVRARLPFRVTVLDGPDGGSRLVVDVGHAW